jgi:hypothetical protein
MRVCSWLMSTLYGHDTIVYASVHYFPCNCSPTVDVGFVKLTSASFWGNTSSRWIHIQFCCHLCCNRTVIIRNNPSHCRTISFCHRWLSPTVPPRWCCLPRIRVCRPNLRNCRS